MANLIRLKYFAVWFLNLTFDLFFDLFIFRMSSSKLGWCQA